MSRDHIIEPTDIVELVEHHIDGERADVRNYDNREFLDESGVFGLHRLAADIYARGYEAGERSERLRAQGRAARQAAAGKGAS